MGVISTPTMSASNFLVQNLGTSTSHSSWAWINEYDALEATERML